MRFFILGLFLISKLAFADTISLDQWGLTGTWYDPTHSGQGFMIEVFVYTPMPKEGIIFGGWFTYDPAGTGAQRWYSIQGSVVDSDESAALQIYQASDGYFGALPGPKIESVGTATLQFTDCNHGQIAYSFGPLGEPHGTIPLVRLTGYYAKDCIDSHTSVGGPVFVDSAPEWLSGSWYDPAVSGQGLTFSFGSEMSDGWFGTFGGWYTFTPSTHRADSPNQIWYSLQSPQMIALDADNNYALSDISIYATSGGGFVSASAIQTTQVGTASLKATTCTSMTLDYEFTAGVNAGSSGTLHLQRPGPAPARCNYGSLHQ